MGSVLGSYFKIYGAQICPIFTKRATLIRDVTRNEQHSIKSGILYSFNLSQGAKKGIVRGGNVSPNSEYLGYFPSSLGCSENNKL